MLTKEEAQTIVDAIVADLLDRGGLGNAFEECDEGVRNEIREAWTEVILRGIRTCANVREDVVAHFHIDTRAIRKRHADDPEVQKVLDTVDELAVAWRSMHATVLIP